MDYEFFKKGFERVDGINDVEEFGIIEVSKSWVWYLNLCYDEIILV